MKTSAQGRMFTALFTFLATLFGMAFGLSELQGQADRFSDVAKICALLAVGSFCLSHIIWTLTHLQKDNVFRGGLAGLLTGLVIIQVPYFATTLKTEFVRHYSSETMGTFLSVLKSIPPAMQTGLETFQVNSKIALMAVMSSVILGVLVSKFVPPR